MTNTDASTPHRKARLKETTMTTRKKTAKRPQHSTTPTYDLRTLQALINGPHTRFNK